MHKTLSVLCLAILVGFIAIPARADDKPIYTVTITGEGVVSAVPNQVDIFMTIEASSTTNQKDALRDQATKVKQVIDFLRKEGVADKNITTQSYQFGPQYEYDRQTSKRKLVGYKATQRLKIRVPRVFGGSIIDGISKLVFINQVRFVLSNRKELLEVAVNSAIADAKAKAQRRASTLGIKLGAILGYREGTSRSPQLRFKGRALAMSADVVEDVAPSLPAGEAEIRSFVSVTYELIPSTD